VKRSIFSIIAICAICVLGIVPASIATTYIFGEDGLVKDLTNYSSSWTNLDTYIIAGDCYVDDDDTLIIGAGVTVEFDFFYGADYGTPKWPTIEVKGTIICNGISSSHITFTNSSGTNKGEFEGLFLNGEEIVLVHDYEGVLKGQYVDLIYGGHTDGLIRIGEDGVLDLDNSSIRHSDNHGVYFEDLGGIATLDTCEIDSCDQNGITWSKTAGDEGVVKADHCSFVENNAGAVELPPSGDQILNFHNMVNGYYQHDWGRNDDEHITISDESHGIIANNYFIGDAVGIFFLDETYCPEGEEWVVYNNVFCRVGTGIYIDDLDFANGDDALFMKVYHNVFWQIRNEGIYIAGFASNSADWPVEFMEFELNLFDEVEGAIKHAVQYETGGNPDAQIPASNALVGDDDVFNASDAICLVEGVNGVVITLTDEVAPAAYNEFDPENWDFHIKWDGNNSLIDVSDEGAGNDPDGSDADVGCYGGAYGDGGIGRVENGFHPGGINNGTWSQNGANRNYNPFYIYLGGSTDGDATFINTDYYMFEDFTVTSGDSLKIDAGTRISARGATIDFKVYGVLEANGTSASESNSVQFIDGTTGESSGYNSDGDGWNGITISGDEAAGTTMDYVLVGGADNAGDEGIRINDVAPTGDDIVITNCHLTYNSIGILVNLNCPVVFTRTEVDHNPSGGVVVISSDTDQMLIKGLNSHHNEHGIELINADVTIDDDGTPETDLDDNDVNGLRCSGSSPNMNNGNGNIAIDQNTDSEIYLASESYPVISGGHHNIIEAGDDYCVEFGGTPSLILDAEDNWWGESDPSDDLFELPAKIDVDPADNSINEVTDFDRGKASKAAGDYGEAIRYFKRAVYAEACDGNRFTALRWLAGCYRQAGAELSELREFYLEASQELAGSRLGFEARSQYIWTLSRMGRHEDALRGFEGRRERVNNRVDSLQNEVELLIAAENLRGMNEIDSDDEIEMSFLDQMDLLQEQIAAADDGGDIGVLIPVTIQLHAAFPNPFNSMTKVLYDLNAEMQVDLAVYDIRGSRIATLYSGERSGGVFEAAWNAKDVPSGVYMIELNTPSFKKATKVVLLK